MARTLRVKIPVAVLIASAEAQREKIIKDHEKQVAKGEKERQRWLNKAEDAVVRVLDDLQNGTIPDSVRSNYYSEGKNRSSFRIEVAYKCPTEPGDTPDTSRVDRDLALLRACSDAELSIGTDDNFARYL